MPPHHETKFAPAARSELKTLQVQQGKVLEQFDEHLFSTVPIVGLVLNANRQIVHANQAMLDFISARSVKDVLGMRPGEVFRCVHSEEEPGGCGTASGCAYCGALGAVLEAGKGASVEREGKVMVRLGEGRFGAFTLRANASPLMIGSERFIVFYLQNIVDSKLREHLEQTFFHDVKNALNGIIGSTAMLRDEVEGENRELADMVLERSHFLEREIDAHRMILFAEKDMLEVHPADVDPGELCRNLLRLFRSNGNYSHLVVKCESELANCTISTDKRILYRVMENLLRNACEASKRGDVVRFGYAIRAEAVEFYVSNAAHMPKAVQSQVFMQSFSTKGKGRGIGTFSTRLLTENYLAGAVRFTSDANEGTTFYVRLPLSLTHESSPPTQCAPAEKTQ